MLSLFNSEAYLLKLWWNVLQIYGTRVLRNTPKCRSRAISKEITAYLYNKINLTRVFVVMYICILVAVYYAVALY